MHFLFLLYNLHKAQSDIFGPLSEVCRYNWLISKELLTMINDYGRDLRGIEITSDDTLSFCRVFSECHIHELFSGMSCVGLTFKSEWSD